MNEQNALIIKNQSEVPALKHNLSENYLEIEKLLLADKKSEAMEFISRQTDILDNTRVKKFCQSPLINAALSIYIRREEKLNIKITSKTDLPPKMTTDDSDLAVLVSNLLENAINASLKQKSPDEREISIIIKFG